MNGYTLANHFRKLRYSFPFSSVEADLFYELVAVCNERNWPTEFQYSNPLLCATLGMVETTLIRARNRLKQAGLLEFTSGHKRSPTVYRFLDPDAPQIPLPKASKSASTNARISESISARRSETPIKEQTKRKTKPPSPAPAVEAGEGVSDSISIPDPLPAWQAWLQANAPEVQRLKTPLTAETYLALVADFGESLVQEVLLAMQNHAGLTKKYTSAHLTARNWCQRRQPAEPATPRPAPRPVPAPVLDPEATAANYARQQDALRQRIDARKQTQAALAA